MYHISHIKYWPIWLKKSCANHRAATEIPDPVTWSHVGYTGNAPGFAQSSRIFSQENLKAVLLPQKSLRTNRFFVNHFVGLCRAKNRIETEIWQLF